MNMATPSSSNPMFFGAREEHHNQIKQHQHSSLPTSSTAPTTATSQKKKRNLPGTPNPDAEVIALSPKTLMATNRFICEVCNKGFQREQNLQLHRRGHNLPWKLKQKTNKEVKKKVYLCPEPTCVHHDHSRALGDLTGIKKHYSRKHGEKKYKCEKCSKKYAVQSDWKAHSKTCGTREYRCDCGTLFSRRDSFITHRAFCDALAQESARLPSGLNSIGSHLYGNNHMNLNLSQIGNHIPSNNMLRLGAPKLEQLIPNSSNHSPLFNSQPPQSMSSSPFFMDNSNQVFQEMQNKPFHQGLMQLPDLQSNTSHSPGPASAAVNLFNLGFYSSTNTTNSMNNTEHASNNTTNLSSSSLLLPDHQFSNGNIGGQGTENLFSGNDHVGVGLSYLHNTNVPHENQNQATPHMSATALLQKAAQLGSTTSNASATLLKGLGSSSSMSGSSKFGRSFSSGNSEHDQNQLQGLMNSLANGNSSSMFGGGSDQVQDNNFGGFSRSGSMRLEQQNRPNFGDMDEAAKMNQGFSLSMGGSDRMTLDFLGVGGGIMRTMSSLDHQKRNNSSQASHLFGGPKLQ